MSRVYLTPLPNSQANTSDEGVRAQIQQSGLLQEGGTAVEKIAQDNIDLVVSGTFNFGATFSQKVADELESLSESTYNGLPVFNPDVTGGGRNVGYYELERVDVSPAHPVNQDAFEYTAAFKFTGTRETHWSAVQTNIENIQTGLATGSGGLIGIPATAGKTKWFGVEEGTEAATSTSTVTAEFGDVDLFDPTDTTIVNPTLLYELDYADAGGVDVRVFDDRDVSKYFRSGGQDYGAGDYGAGPYGAAVIASRWTHAYHTSFEFEGDPLVDNGLFRVGFDEAAGEVTFERLIGEKWEDRTPTQTDYNLVDADFEHISPMMATVFCEFEKTNNSTEYAVLRIQRGQTNIVLREPDNGTLSTDLETMLSPICTDDTTDVQPARTLKSRNEVK